MATDQVHARRSLSVYIPSCHPLMSIESLFDTIQPLLSSLVDVEIFKAGQGVTQEGPLLPKILNIMVDAIVREWLRDVSGGSNAGEYSGFRYYCLFYADNSMIASTDADLLQEEGTLRGWACSLTFDKTKAMPMVNTKVCTQLSESSYKRRYLGLNTTEQWNSRVC